MTNETNVQPTDDEDITGHGVRVKWVEPADEDDTIDTEGHARVAVKVEPAGEDDTVDTEGHLARSGRSHRLVSSRRSAGPRIQLDEGEDTGGRAVRPKG